MKKSWLLRGMSVVMLSGLLVGCGGNQVSETTAASKEAESTVAQSSVEANPDILANGEEVTLRFAWWGSQNRHERTQKVCEMFMEKYPNVTIVMEPYDFTGYFQKLSTLTGAGDVWDVFQMGNGFAEYNECIADLSPYLDNGMISTDNIEDAFLKVTQYDGKQAGISLGTNAFCVIYNADMLAEAGLEEPKDNWTWEEYQKYAEALKEVTGEFGSSKLENFYGATMVGVPQYEQGLNFFSADNQGLDITDSKYLVPYMQMIKEMTDSGAYPDPGAIAEIGTDPSQDFVVTGEAAMTWLTSNQFVAVTETAAKNDITNLKLATVPRRTEDGPSGLAIRSSMCISMSTNCEKTDVAAAFIDFFVNDEEANKILAGERGVPISSSIRTALEGQLTDAEKAIYTYIDKIGRNGDGQYVNLNEPAPMEAIRDRFNLDMEKVISGEMTAEEAAQDVLDFSNQQFAK